MKKILFSLSLIITACVMGNEFGQYWVPRFYLKYVNDSVDPDKAVITGGWALAVIALCLAIVYVRGFVTDYGVAEFMLGIAILVATGAILTLLTGFIVPIFIGALVLGILSWLAEFAKEWWFWVD